MIDSRAVIDQKAELDENIHIGPYSIIGANVEIQAGTWIGPHVVIDGPARIGRDNKIYQFASLGGTPQDKKYGGEPDTRLEIGDRNEIREYCTMSRGTVQGGGVTRVGSDNWIMAYTHIAHDCHVGNHTVFANVASLAGHVSVGDYATLGGFAGVHQYCAIGAYSFTAGGSIVFKDVPPFIMVSGNTAEAHGLNREGLKRRGFDEETLRKLRLAYKIIYKRNLTLKNAIETLRPLSADCPQIDELIRFLEQSTRGIVR
ncbi:MAG: acyl-ACP--UDP-N-acetylglucosamine O-acyltransferase [Gammaproteobacteria bacterium]|nr:acyl-ACP--UDP-N-acetylglucosamine O-acyltransferase [Gammaproteobacteria bacterium]